MMPISRPLPPRRPHSALVAGLTLLVLGLLGGCSSPIALTTNPSGATAYVDGKPVGLTPAQVPLESKKPVLISLSLEGYFPEAFTVQPAEDQHEIAVKLEPKTLAKTYDFGSNPDGATVIIDRQQVGTTPVNGVKVTYVRENKAGPWLEKTLVVSKTNYQSETVALGSTTNSVPTINLTLLREDRVYTIVATTTDGSELSADVTLNGTVVGQTPLKLPITFQRADKTSAWPKFDVTGGRAREIQAREPRDRFHRRHFAGIQAAADHRDHHCLRLSHAGYDAHRGRIQGRPGQGHREPQHPRTR